MNTAGKKFYKHVKTFIPKILKPSLRTYCILNFEYGHLKSVKNRTCMDNSGAPIPWYTYPATEYIKQLDFSEKMVFEYGVGSSTLFWSKLAKKVVSVEDNIDWYERIMEKVGSNVDLIFADAPIKYINAISDTKDYYDVIIIDGSHRLECCKQAIRRLQDGGMIILDNSDWFYKSAAVLREANLIQVDMTGFGPINGYTWTTSFFLSKEFRPIPLYDRLPIHALGGLVHLED